MYIVYLHAQVIVMVLLYRGDWTKTSHMRAIDVWIVLCYIGVFSALIEYCLVLHLTKMALWESPFINANTASTMTGDQVITLHTYFFMIRKRFSLDPQLKKTFQNNKPAQHLRWARILEQVSRIIFPTYNLLFFTLYFLICLCH